MTTEKDLPEEKPVKTVAERAHELSETDGDEEVAALAKFGFGCGMLHRDGPPRWSKK